MLGVKLGTITPEGTAGEDDRGVSSPAHIKMSTVTRAMIRRLIQILRFISRRSALR